MTAVLDTVSTGREVATGQHRERGPIVRVAAPLLGLFAISCGVVAAVPVPTDVRAIMLGLFVLLGPGIAVVMRMSLPTPAAVAAVPTIGLCTIAGTTTVLLWFHRWPERQLFWIMLVVTGIAILRHPQTTAALLRLRAIRFRPLRGTVVVNRRTLIANPPLVLLAVALLGWLLVLAPLRNVPYSQFGLLFVSTGPAIVVCTLLAVAAFLWALYQNRLRTAALAIGVVIVIERLTVTLITQVPIYGWTYKHLGVVDYIHRFGAIPPGNDIYGQWPSFFAFTAWFSGITGIAPITIAHFFAPLLHVLLAVLIGAIARLVGLDSRTALAAAMIAELVNWVGQDYFSPQACAIAIALGIVALLVASRTVPTAGYLSIPLFAVLVPLHQLTPYWVFGIAVVLASTRRLRPWWLPIPYAGLLAAYLIPRLPIVAPYGIFSGFNPVANAHSNADFAGTFGKTFTSLICRSLSAAIVLLAVVCAVMWWRQRKPCLVPVVLAFTSFAVLMSQNYGGEAIFRVYLFALAGCAILIAPLVTQALSARPQSALTRALIRLCVGAGFGLAVFSGLQGYYGMWSIVIEYPSQIRWGDEFMARQQPPLKVISLYPAGFSTRSTADYARFTAVDQDFDQTLPGMPGALEDNFASEKQLDELTRTADAFDGNTYIVFDRQAKLGLEYYGLLGPGMTQRFTDLVAHNPAWQLYRAGDVTTMYKFDRAAVEHKPAPRR